MFLKKSFLSFTILLSLCACGEKSLDLIVGRAEAPDPALSPLNTDNYSLSYENRAPQNFGEPWSRLIKVSGPVLEGFMVEKEQGPENWIFVGKTNAEGHYLDQKVAELTRYRVGRKLVSDSISGVFDQVLVGSLESSISIQAERVVIPRDQIFEIGELELSISATEFLVEGTLRAFNPDSVGGRNAGSLHVKAQRIKGSGTIDLRGQNGRNGLAAPPTPDKADLSCSNYDPNASQGVERFQRSIQKVVIGHNGADGAAGQNGGRGGSVKFEVAEDQFSAFPTTYAKVLVGGGRGGHGSLGAKGGQGGRMRFCKCWNSPDSSMLWMELSNWGAYPLGYCIDPYSRGLDFCMDQELKKIFCHRPGEDGKDGAPGFSGADGSFDSLPLR